MRSLIAALTLALLLAGCSATTNRLDVYRAGYAALSVAAAVYTSRPDANPDWTAVLSVADAGARAALKDAEHAGTADLSTALAGLTGALDAYRLTLAAAR